MTNNNNTIPASGYYSWGMYTDEKNQIHPHLKWYGTSKPQDLHWSVNLGFFEKDFVVPEGTIITYPVDAEQLRLDAASDYVAWQEEEETYLDIEDEQAYDWRSDEKAFDLLEDSSEQEAYTSLRDALVEDMKEFDRVDFSFPVPGRNELSDEVEPEEEVTSTVELETLKKVRERLVNWYDEGGNYDHFLGLSAAVAVIDKMITELKNKQQ